MKRSLFVLAGATLVAALTLAENEKPSTQTGAAPAAAAHATLTPAAMKAAETDYKAKCASCHGPAGKGNAVLAKSLKVTDAQMNLVDADTLAKTDEELSAATTDGKGKMPAYNGKLTPEQIKALTAFVRSLGEKAAAPAK